MSEIIQAAIPFVLAAIGYLIYWVVKMLRKRTENEDIKNALLVVEDAIYSVVCGLNGQANTLRDERGKLSQEAAEALKREAAEKVKSLVEERVKSTLATHFKDIDTFMSGKIDLAAKKVKQETSAQSR